MTIALRVAARFQRQGGIFQAPPGMHEDIYSWILAVAAANGVKEAEASLKSMGTGQHERSDKFDGLLKALDALEAAPTNWKAYTAVHEQLWVFGHPGARWSVKDFQKLTPEKKQDLTERVKTLCAAAREQVERNRENDSKYHQKARTDLEAEIARLRPFLHAGVEAMSGDSVSRDFPINLKGWKYGEDELQEKAVQRYREQQSRLYDTLTKKKVLDEEAAAFAREYAENILENLKTNAGVWKSIKVKLTTVSSKGYSAFWQKGQRLILIILPYGTKPYELETLGETLYHELQHFAQDYLDYVLNGEFRVTEPDEQLPGHPSKKIMTPEYKQWHDPKHPSYKSDNPDTVMLQKKLREQGIDPRFINLHDLDDMEFYTVLSNAINDFRRIWARVKGKGDLSTAIKLFTAAIPYPDSGSSVDTPVWHKQMEALGGYDFVQNFKPYRFFKTLRKHAPGKYRKALSEFVKAVS